MKELVGIYHPAPERHYLEAVPIIERMCLTMKEKYGSSSKVIREALCGTIPQILHLTGGDVSGKVILDLGCGSDPAAYKDAGSNDERYKPWLCRCL
ncbi:TPA: hypothetical protein HA265_02255, partial [Candidatus Woesearchaeota archaeon]|nr:hypothetical protein [Candidatus Woesearchaeota archaeon]